MADEQGNVLDSVEIQIVAELKRLQETLKNGRDQVKATVQSWRNNFGDAIRDVAQLKKQSAEAGEGIKEIGRQLAGAFAVYKLTGLVKDVTLLAARVDVLGVVARNMGRNAGYSADEIDRQAEAVKSMGITSRASYQTITQLIQAQLDLSKSAILARTAQDAAVIGNVNSSEALERIIHGIVTLQPEILRTVGIIVNFEMEYAKWAKTAGRTAASLTGQEKQQIALNAVLEKGRLIAGSYEAAMSKAGKQVTSLERYIEELKVMAGQEFQPVFSEVVITMTNFFKNAAKSGEVTELARGFANILQRAFRTIVEIVTFLIRHRDLVASVFSFLVIHRFTRGLVLMISQLYAAATATEALQVKMLLTNIALNASIGIGTILGLMFGKDLPKAIHILILAIDALVIALIALNASFRGLYAALGPAGWIILGLSTVFSLTGLVAGAFDDATESIDTLGQKQAELSEEAKATAAEYVALRQRALEMMTQYVRMYDTAKKSAEGKEQLLSILQQINDTVPGLLPKYATLGDAFLGIKAKVTELRKELGELRSIDLRTENAKLEDRLSKLAQTVSDSQAQNVLGIKQLANAVVDASKTGDEPTLIAAMDAFRTTYAKVLDELSGQVAGQQNEKVRQATQGLRNQVVSLNDAVQLLFGTKKQIFSNSAELQRLLSEGVALPEIKGGPAQLVDPDDVEKANKLLRDFQEDAIADEQKRSMFRLESWRIEQQLKIDELKTKGVQTNELQLALDSAYAAKKKEIEDDAAQESEELIEKRYSLRAELDDRELESYRDYLKKQQAALDTSIPEQLNAWLELESKIDAIQNRINKREHKNAEDRVKAWYDSNTMVVGIMRGMEGAYDATIDSITDFEMTGKRRRELMWQAGLKAFVGYLGQRLKAMLFTHTVEEGVEKKGLLTSIFVSKGKQAALIPTILTKVVSIITNIFEWFTALLGPFGIPAAVAAGLGVRSLIMGMLPRKRRGGYTGNLPEDMPAGIVEGKEFVVSAPGTRKNRDLLELMNSGLDVGQALRDHLALTDRLSNRPSAQMDRLFGKLLDSLTTIGDGIQEAVLPMNRQPATVAVVDSKGLRIATVHAKKAAKRTGLK